MFLKVFFVFIKNPEKYNASEFPHGYEAAQLFSTLITRYLYL